jgi:hypothetical protein
VALQTGKKVSSSRKSLRSPGYRPWPKRIATSTSSREKSVRSCEICTRTSSPGCVLRSEPRRGISQFAAKEGIVLTVSMLGLEARRSPAVASASPSSSVAIDAA